MPPSALRRNPHEPLIPGLLETPADHVKILHPPLRAGGASLALRTKRDGWSERLVPINDLAGEVGAFRGMTDVFLSQQTFNGWRRIAQLRDLAAAYVDVDFHRMPAYKNVSAEWMANIVLRALDDASMPAPSYVLSTGRGILLVWLHSVAPRAALPRWMAVQRALVDVLRPFGGDTGALDATRVFRLIGTTNSKSDGVVGLVWPTSAPTGFHRWDFDELAREVLPLDRSELVSLNAERARRRAEGASLRPATRLGAATYWEAVLTDLQRLRRARWFGTLPPGQRDWWLFLACNAMSWMVPLSGLRRECYALAQEAGSTWSDRETDQRMGTVYRRAAAAARGELVEFAGAMVDPRYRFKASTIIDRLEITGTEMRDAGLRVLVDQDRRRELVAERQRESRKERGLVKRDREQYRRDVQEGSIQAQKPWETLGMSRRTWYRRGCPTP